MTLKNTDGTKPPAPPVRTSPNPAEGRTGVIAKIFIVDLKGLAYVETQTSRAKSRAMGYKTQGTAEHPSWSTQEINQGRREVRDTEVDSVGEKAHR